jgi:predicted DNA-binding transcriptional regulator YafY
MPKSTHLQRYLFIIRKIRSTPHISMEELVKAVEREVFYYGDTAGTSKRTVRRDFADIQEIFGLEIKYSKANNGYFISEIEQSDVERQLEYFDLLNVLQGGLENFVFTEKRKSRGTEHLRPLIFAIKNSLQVEFRYRKFDNTVTKERRVVEPYALKEFKGRWYLLAIEIGGRLEERGAIKTWGLDRIENFYLSNTSFSKNAKIDAEDEFSTCFGIFSNEEKAVEEVILSFTPMSGKYNEALPLHASQKTLIDDENEFRISLKVKITYDFVMELLSQTETMRVVSPTHLRERLVGIYEGAIQKNKES